MNGRNRLIGLIFMGVFVNGCQSAFMNSSKYVSVDLNDVVTHPQRYEDKKVLLIGYLSPAIMRLMPYKNGEPIRGFQHSLQVWNIASKNSSSSLSEEIKSSSCYEHKVSITGIVSKIDYETGAPTWRLTHVSAIYAEPGHKICWQNLEMMRTN